MTQTIPPPENPARFMSSFHGLSSPGDHALSSWLSATQDAAPTDPLVSKYLIAFVQPASMRALPLFLTLYPLSLIAMAAAERCSLLWLDINPGSPAAWELWLNLHAISGRAWLALEPALGDGITAHFASLLVLVALVVLASHSGRWRTYSFLLNHATLIVAGAFSLLQLQGNVSSLGSMPPSVWAIAWAAQLSPMQAGIIAGGLASCTLCHAAMIAQMREGKAVRGG